MGYYSKDLGKFIGFCADERLHGLIKTEARLLGVSVSKYVRRVLESHFTLLEQELQRQQQEQQEQQEANDVFANNK